MTGAGPVDPDAMEPPERWLVVSTEAPPRGHEVLAVEALRRFGARSVDARGGRLVAEIPAPADPEALVGEVEMALRSALGRSEVELEWSWRSGEEWAERWAREMRPLRVGERFVVAPAGRDLELREGEVAIRLRPGVGFGTAGHATTRACLHELDALVEEGHRIADVGAGSGILSVAAARLGAGEVLALERDPMAASAARANVAENGVDDRVQVRELEVRPGDLRRLGRFDGVVANVGTELLTPGFASALPPALASRGWVVLAGFSRGDRSAVLEAVREGGLALEGERTDDGWWTVRLRPEEGFARDPGSVE